MEHELLKTLYETQYAFLRERWRTLVDDYQDADKRFLEAKARREQLLEREHQARVDMLNLRDVAALNGITLPDFLLQEFVS